MKRRFVRIIRCENERCEEKYALPIPSSPSSEAELPETATRLWSFNFYCPICRRVQRVRSQKLAWVSVDDQPASATRLGDVAHRITFGCDHENCKSPIRLLVLGDESETAADVLRRHEGLGIEVACPRNHPPTKLTREKGAIPSKERIQEQERNDAPADKFIEFFRCGNCNKPYRVPSSRHPLLEHILPSQSRGKPSVFLACEACNDLRLYSTRDLPVPRIFGTQEGDRAIYVGKFFRAEISCADKSCESRTVVIAPTPEHYDLDSIEKRYSLLWNPQNISCAEGHPIRKPVAVVSIEEIAV